MSLNFFLRFAPASCELGASFLQGGEQLLSLFGLAPLCILIRELSNQVLGAIRSEVLAALQYLCRTLLGNQSLLRGAF